MTDYGVLGICFVVLYFLGYASTVILTIGVLLVMLSSYMYHMQFKAVLGILIAGYFGVMDEEE